MRPDNSGGSNYSGGRYPNVTGPMDAGRLDQGYATPAAPPVKHTPEITEHLQITHKFTELLADTVSRLEDRVAVVSRPEQTVAGSAINGLAPSTSVPLAIEIESVHLRLAHVNRRLQNMIDRIEL